MDIENETDISEDERRFPFLMEELELAIKEMKNGRATGIDGIPIEGVQDYHPDITHSKDSPENIKSTSTF